MNFLALQSDSFRGASLTSGDSQKTFPILICDSLFGTKRSSCISAQSSSVRGLDHFLEDPRLGERFARLLSSNSKKNQAGCERESVSGSSCEGGKELEREDFPADSGRYIALKKFLVCFLYAPPSEKLPTELLSISEVEYLRLLLKHRLTLPRKKETKLGKIDSGVFDQKCYLEVCEELREELRPAENPILKRTLANQIQKLKRKRQPNCPEPFTWPLIQERLIQDSKSIFVRRFHKLMQALKDAVETSANHSLFNNFHLPLIRVQISKAPELLGDGILAGFPSLTTD